MGDLRPRGQVRGGRARGARCLPALCVPALLLPLAAHAAEWGLDPSITAGVRYDDNQFLSTAAHDAVSGIVITPRLEFGAREPHWEVRGDAQLRSGRYSEDSLDSDDSVFAVKSRFLAPRNTWTLDLSHARESIVTSDVVDPDTGLAQGQRERETQAAAPGWSWSLSPGMQFAANYQFVGVQYEDGISVNLFDYRQDTYTLQLTRQQTERTLLSLTAFIADFGLDNDRFHSRTTGIQAGFTHQLSETLDLSLALGGRRTEIDQSVTVCSLSFFGICLATADEERHSSDTGYLVNASLTKRFELVRLQFELADNVAPSGSGSQVESYTATLRIERPVGSPQFGVRLLALGLRSRTIGGDAAGNDRDLYRVEPGWFWRPTAFWTLDMTYRYTRQKFDNHDMSAAGNAVFLNIGYRPQRIVFP